MVRTLDTLPYTHFNVVRFDQLGLSDLIISLIYNDLLRNRCLVLLADVSILCDLV